MSGLSVLSPSLTPSVRSKRSDLRIEGIGWFPETSWKRAFYSFLSHYDWKEGEIPQIHFGRADLVLRLQRDGRYVAFGSTYPSNLSLLPNEMLCVGPGKNEVEAALWRLMEENAVEGVAITFWEGTIHLWKEAGLGYLNVSAVNIPTHGDYYEQFVPS